ncbi:MAG: NADH-quinone oxidoreductase subunit J [Chloroflexi bacterium]|nr:NADH-quinone oxidoreductase subunit J [Chloroflexota bacterium]
MPADIDGLSLSFWILAVVTVGAAVAVVATRNIFRAAIYLVLSFVTIAALYLTLSAEFLAAVQILIYAGAIAVLLIFGIMLTREQRAGSPSGRLSFPALGVAGLVAFALTFVILGSRWNVSQAPLPADNTVAIADALFNQFVLPFELASVLLLAAIIGAIVLVRGSKE